MRKLGKLLVSFVISSLFLADVSWSNVQISVSPENQVVGLGQAFGVVISFSGDVKDISLDQSSAEKTGVQLSHISRSSSSQVQIINGKMTSKTTKSIRIHYRSSALGPILLGPYRGTVNGQAFQTKSVSVVVKKGAVQGQNPRNQIFPPSSPFGNLPGAPMDKSINEALEQFLGKNQQPNPVPPKLAPDSQQLKDELAWIEVEFPKKEIYQRQAVPVRWHLFANQRVHFYRYDPLLFPSLNGFWKEERVLPNQVRFSSFYHNNIRYKRSVLLDYILFPIEAGEAEIDSYNFKIFYAPYLGAPRQAKVLKTKPHKFLVKPLPEPKPQNFSGGVGQFKVQLVRQGTEKIEAGTPFAVNLEFLGTGHGAFIQVDSLIKLPSGLKIYDKKEETQFIKPESFSKKIILLLIAEKSGQIVWPQWSLSFFNPETKKYESKLLPQLVFQVAPSSKPLDLHVKKDNSIMDLKENIVLNKRYSVGVSILVMLFVLFSMGMGYYRFIYLKSPSIVFKKRVLKMLAEAQRHLSKNQHKALARSWIDCLSFLVASFEQKEGLDRPLIEKLRNVPAFIRLDVQEDLLDIYQTSQEVAFSQGGISQVELSKKQEKFLFIANKLSQNLNRILKGDF